MKHGYGELEFADGDNYKGLWENDKINGKGKYEFANGAKCEDDFISQIKWRRFISFLNGNKYKGSFKNGKREVSEFLL